MPETHVVTWRPDPDELTEHEFLVDLIAHRAVRPSFGYAGGDPGEPAWIEVLRVRPINGSTPEQAAQYAELLDEDSAEAAEFFGAMEREGVEC